MVAERLAIADEMVAGPIIAIEAAGIGADPQFARRVPEQAADETVGQAAGVGGVGEIGAEAIAVPAGEAALGAGPDEAVAVLGQGGDDLVGQAIIEAVMAKDRRREAFPAFTGESLAPAQDEQDRENNRGDSTAHGTPL